MKKKILSLLFIFLFVLGLSSCKKHPSYKNLNKIQVEEDLDYVPNSIAERKYYIQIHK